MSNQTISMSRELAELCFRNLNGGDNQLTGMEHGQAFRDLRALLAKPAKPTKSECPHCLGDSMFGCAECEPEDLGQHQGEPVAVVLPEQWLPIETAPKDETEIILRKGDRVTAGAWIEWSKSHAEHHSTTGEYLGQVEYDSGANWASWDGGFCEDDEPTHWQPMPTPPQQ